VSPVWVVIGLVIAVGLGIMLSVSGGKPEITREIGTEHPALSTARRAPGTSRTRLILLGTAGGQRRR